MKFRIGFVTNSSSYSSLIVHHIESETLEKIFKKYGMELSILNGIHTSSFGELGRSVSDIIIELSSYDEFRIRLQEKYKDLEVKLENAIEEIVKLIKKQKSLIDADVSCYIQLYDYSNEWSYNGIELLGLSGRALTHVTLELKNGKGRFIIDEDIFDYDGDDFSDYPEGLPSGVNVYPIMLGGVYFSVIGRFNNYSQKRLVKKIKDAGGYVEKTVTQNTNYLVTNNQNDYNPVIQKAKEFGVSIISEIEFDKMYSNLVSGINLNQEYLLLNHEKYEKSDHDLSSLEDKETNNSNITIQSKKGKYNILEEDDYYNGKFDYNFNSLHGLRFALSNDFQNFCLEGIKALIEKCGGIINYSVDKETDYVVCNFPDSDNTKLKKAAKHGIPVISEHEFEKMVGKRTKGSEHDKKSREPYQVTNIHITDTSFQTFTKEKCSKVTSESYDGYFSYFEYNSLNGLIFAITGDLDHFSREEIILLIKKCGGAVKDHVTKNTNYVITNYPDSGTSKLKKAAEYRIPVISEQEFEKMLGKRVKGSGSDSNSNEQDEIKSIYNIDTGFRTTTKEKYSKPISESNNGYFNPKYDYSSVDERTRISTNSNSHPWEKYNDVEEDDYSNGQYEYNKDSLNGLRFGVTGDLDHYCRVGIIKLIEECGGVFKDSISKKTNYVITNFPNSGTSKLKKAAEYCIPVISEEEFEKMVGKRKKEC